MVRKSSKSTSVCNDFHPWKLNMVNPTPYEWSNTSISLCFSSEQNYNRFKQLNSKEIPKHYIYPVYNHSSIKWFYFRKWNRGTRKSWEEKKLCFFRINRPILLDWLHKVGISQSNKCLWSGLCVYVHVYLYVFNILRPESFHVNIEVLLIPLQLNLKAILLSNVSLLARLSL